MASYGGTQEFISEMINATDKVIEEAVIGPSEAILKIKSLPLKEKLALWGTREEKMNFYRKMDIGEYLIVLESIKGYKSDEKTQWTLLKIPFDVSNPTMMDSFLAYVDELFIAKRDVISKPTCLLKELYELELYYQKINLYYSFSKTFNLDFDVQWVYDERIVVSEDINKILLNI